MVLNYFESVVEMEESEEDSNYLEILQRLESGSVSGMDLDTDSRKRKRSRILSWEEKIQLKKLRNRIAAQTSRDRKKARMDYLEDSLKDLIAQNDKFQSEIEALRKKNQELEDKNEQLTADLLRISGKREQFVGDGQPQRPAESFDPQQKGPWSSRADLTPSAAIFLKTLILMSLTRTCYSTGAQTSTKNSRISCSEIWNRLASNPDKMVLWEKIVKPLLEKNQHILREWWGKQQKSWNPIDQHLIRCSA